MRKATLIRYHRKKGVMTDQTEGAGETESEESEEEQSFRERVEDIRQERSEEGGRDAGDAGDVGGGGGPSGSNPFQEMVSGVMSSAGAEQGMPGGGGGGGEELVEELEKHREEVAGVREELERIADALED